MSETKTSNVIPYPFTSTHSSVTNLDITSISVSSTPSDISIKVWINDDIIEQAIIEGKLNFSDFYNLRLPIKELIQPLLEQVNVIRREIMKVNEEIRREDKRMPVIEYLRHFIEKMERTRITTEKKDGMIVVKYGRLIVESWITSADSKRVTVVTKRVPLEYSVLGETTIYYTSP